MSKRPYDVLVFIGRFSPFHKGHEAVIDQALLLADKVVVLVGSAYAPRDIRDPWTFEERLEMMRAVYTHGGAVPSRIIVKPLPDYPYNNTKWKTSVRSTVMSGLSWSDKGPKIGLIGHAKDHTSFYLKMFPDWRSVDVDNYMDINATDFREAMFNRQPIPKIGTHGGSMCHPNVEEMAVAAIPEHLYAEWENTFLYNKPYVKLSDKDLQQWAKDNFDQNPVKMLRAFSDEYRPKYPPVYVTVDNVIIQSGHVLLVQRGAYPGKGLWAIPGGFLEQHERLIDGAVREPREETKIDVPPRLMRRLMKGTSHTFDDPYRSTRGRTITQAFFTDLGDDTRLPKIKASDDAAGAKWWPLNEVKREMMFEDHFHIIDHFTNIG